MWKTGGVEAEKLSFLALSLAGGSTMTQLCASFGISRQAGYELLARYRTEGLDCARSRSRAPHVQARATAAELVELMVGLRLERPSWGPKKLRARLTMDGSVRLSV